MVTSKQPINKATVLVVTLCWLLIVFEGYDLVVYGTIVPSLLAEKAWSLTPTQAGNFGSYVVIGMLIGALAVGTLTDHIGRKKTLIGSATFCSLFMAGAALAPSPEIFGICRFLTGIGLGGVMPTITVLTLEYAPKGKKAFTVILMYTGYQLGGIIASILALNMIDLFGWRMMFWVGIIPLIIVIPFAALFLPESIAYLLSKGKRSEAEKIAARFQLSLTSQSDTNMEQEKEKSDQAKGLNSIRPLFSRHFRLSTISFWVASFIGLYLIFGLSTWLPTIMRTSGYSLGSSLMFLLVLNLGVIFGNLLTGMATDRWGYKLVCMTSFLIAFISLGLLSLKPSSIFLTYVLIALAGIGSFGTQNLLNAYVGEFYPVTNRATALGWSLGVGRLGGIIAPLVGGWLVSMAVGAQWHFGVFAILGLIGALAITLISKDSPLTLPARTSKSL